MRILPRAILISLAFTAIISACREEDPVRTVSNPGALPTMVTLDVDTYISDSGYVKYHAMTDIWEVYDNTDTPYWRFPHPLIIDIYSPGMKPGSHVECDSAFYWSQQRLFRFDGNVAAVNVDKDTFLTPQLYWDQNARTFYTDSFIHIVKGDRVLEGYGFRSNERMTKYLIKSPTAIIPASELQKKNAAPHAPAQSTDSTAPNYISDDPMYLPTPSPVSSHPRSTAPQPNPANTETPPGEINAEPIAPK